MLEIFHPTNSGMICQVSLNLHSGPETLSNILLKR
jgi:hypothetical protein